MATPLTDGINALTQYANEVTGKQDATLSDAVGSLVEGYGQDGLPFDPQYCKKLDGMFQTAILPKVFDIDLKDFTSLVSVNNMFVNLMGTPGVNGETVTIRNLRQSGNTFTAAGLFYYNSRTKYVNFIDCDFSPINASELFRTSRIEEIQGELDFTNTTNAGQAFNGASNLREIRIKPNSIRINASGTSFYFKSCANLSNESLISITNGLDGTVTGLTLELHATAKDNCSVVTGTNDNGTFIADPSGTLTLADFITTVKGWTLA